MNPLIKKRIDKIALGVSILMLVAVLGGWADFINKHDFHFQSPIVFRSAVIVTERSNARTQVVYAADTNVTPLSPIQQYICNKFGKDCKLALAIQHAENGTGQCDRINWSNQNQSIDIGIFQINSLWIDHKKFPAANLFDCEANVDAAYSIYKANGNSFKDWSTYQSGAYKRYMY